MFHVISLKLFLGRFEGSRCPCGFYFEGGFGVVEGSLGLLGG